MARKQTLEDQVRRMNDLLCPVHGVGLESEVMEYPADFHILTCTRRDCGLMVVADTKLMEARHLITDEQFFHLQRIYGEMLEEFNQRVAKRMNREIRKIAKSPEAQLPVII